MTDVGIGWEEIRARPKCRLIACTDCLGAQGTCLAGLCHLYLYRLASLRHDHKPLDRMQLRHLRPRGGCVQGVQCSDEVMEMWTKEGQGTEAEVNASSPKAPNNPFSELLEEELLAHFDFTQAEAGDKCAKVTLSREVASAGDALSWLGEAGYRLEADNEWDIFGMGPEVEGLVDLARA